VIPPDGCRPHGRDAWIPAIGLREARGRLREVYELLRSHGGGRPAIYSPPGGDVANIVKCHSLDPEGLRIVFALSGEVNWSPRSLPWRLRELVNTVVSAANDCFY
jgi:hypothetical protein